jgi:ABC-type enterochelin transport system ATPase subunit
VNKIGDPIKTHVCVEDISVVFNESGVTTIILRNGCRLTASLDVDTLIKAMYLCYFPPFST